MKKYNCNCDGAATNVCGLPPTKITLRTVVLPAALGTDAEGAPYAPAIGRWYNSVVSYQANGAVYVYDSNGIYTLVEPANYAELVAKVDGLEEALTALQNKEQEDVDNLQININQLANKEAEDVENLQTNINTVANDLEDYKNSPDVRYIEPTYAALEAIDKSTIGDQDYARVLQDETHEDASTYYQFSTTSQTWSYVGMTGPYYTKEQIDEKVQTLTNYIGAINTEKLDGLADIKTIGANLELTSDGTLNATGGGGGGGGGGTGDGWTLVKSIYVDGISQYNTDPIALNVEYGNDNVCKLKIISGANYNDEPYIGQNIYFKYNSGVGFFALPIGGVVETFIAQTAILDDIQPIASKNPSVFRVSFLQIEVYTMPKPANM